ncbi:ATP-binding protein [Streptomyces sp. NPDC004376]
MPFRTTAFKRSSLRVPPDIGAVSAARRRAVEIIRGWCLPLTEDTVQVFELLAGEVIANAVVHTHDGCRVTVSWDGSRVRLEAEDGKPGLLPPGALAGPGEEHGRGLRLVAVLANAWGSRPTKTGKTVWFELVEDKPLSVRTPIAPRGCEQQEGTVATSSPESGQAARSTDTEQGEKACPSRV